MSKIDGENRSVYCPAGHRTLAVSVVGYDEKRTACEGCLLNKQGSVLVKIVEKELAPGFVLLLCEPVGVE